MESTLSICYCIWHTYTHASVRRFRVTHRIEEVLSNTWVELAVASDITGQKCFLILMLRPQTHSLLDWEPTSCLIFVQTVGQQLICEFMCEMTPLMFKDTFWVSLSFFFAILCLAVAVLLKN